MMLPMASVAMAATSTDNLNGRSGVLGLPPFHTWAWTTDGSLNNSFGAGYAGFVDICENYLTKENLAKVKAAKAFSKDSMANILSGSGQSVQEWANSIK